MQTIKRNPFIHSILSLCVLIPFSNTHAEDCNELIRLGLYNVYNTVSEHDSLVSAYHHLCDERYESASSGRKSSMNVSFEYLKVKLGLGGGLESNLSQITHTKFCEDTNNVNKLYTYNSLNSQTIYDGALNAWQNCLTMQARGLKTDIRPTSTFSAVSFDLYWTGSSKATFRGIDQPDLGKADCIVTTTSGTKTITQAVKSDTQFPLTTKASNFVCNRIMTKTADGTKYSEAMRLTVKTSDGSIDIDFPPLGLRRVSIAEMNGLYGRLDSAEKGVVLPGSVVAFSGMTIPNSWLEANGEAVSRTTYSALFAVIGTAFGAGDGYSTFNLPDLRGQFIRGWDNGRGLDPDVSRLLGSTQNDDFKSHSHPLPIETSGGWNGWIPQGSDRGISGWWTHTGAAGGAETRPKNVALMYLIKY